MNNQIVIPRELLLAEIERRCPDALCNAKTRIGLTKEEARAYCGFACERCGRTFADLLTEKDVPEWWEELTITGMHALREGLDAGTAEPNEVIARMSDNFRRTSRCADERGED